jgi:hypothetical protein
MSAQVAAVPRGRPWRARAMGLPDVYPFVLSAKAIEKVRFVHNVIERASR